MAPPDADLKPRDFAVCRHDKLKKDCNECCYVCVHCHLRILDGQMRGAGDGSGKQFSHEACYWRAEAERLLAALTVAQKEAFEFNWRRHVEIVKDYMPPYVDASTRPKLVVRFTHPFHKDRVVFLRHSRGPQQGHGWDVYGDDYLNWELAQEAILAAPVPPGLFKFTQHQPEGT